MRPGYFDLVGFFRHIDFLERRPRMPWPVRLTLRDFTTGNSNATSANQISGHTKWLAEKSPPNFVGYSEEGYAANIARSAHADNTSNYVQHSGTVSRRRIRDGGIS
jgi:hypothetical protein